MADPVLSNVEALQRDTFTTYLVDVTFEVLDPDGDDLTLTVEYAMGVGEPYQSATPQAYDSRHSVTTPLTGIPAVAPAKAYSFSWNAFFDLPEVASQDVWVRVTVDDGGGQDQVVVGPVTVSTQIADTSEEVLNKNLARRGIAERTPLDFLGSGLAIPMRRGSRDFVSASGVENVKNSVQQILGTRASVGNFVGELPWRPDFGSKLWVLRHRANDPTLAAQAEAFVLEALEWEPRVEVTEVEIEQYPDAEPNELRVRVRYRIIDENVDDNRVILPEFEEMVTVA